MEPTEEEAEGSALVPYTSGSASSPVRPTSASSAKQRTQPLYFPLAIKRSFLLLARYYNLPTSPPPSPITSSVLNFLRSFIQVNSNSPLSPIAPRADIEECLLIDTVRWAHARGLPFADPRLALVLQSLLPVHQAAPLHSQPVHQALVPQSLQPVHQAAPPHSQPVHQALVSQSLVPVHQAAPLHSRPVHQALVPQSLQPVHQAAPLPSRPVHQAPVSQSLQPVRQAALLPSQPVHQALVSQSLQPVHQAADHRSARRLQIQYDLPAGVDAIPRSPGTVLIPLQVENSSKKRKVRLQLAATTRQTGIDHTRNLLPEAVSESVELPDAVSGSASATKELPDAPTNHSALKNLPDVTEDFKVLSLADNMADTTLKWQPPSSAGSLEEFDDTPEQLSRSPLAIGGMRSGATQGKQPAYPPHTLLARHGYRQPSVILESEDDDSMDDGLQQQPTQQPYQLPQQPPQQLQ